MVGQLRGMQRTVESSATFRNAGGFKQIR